MEILFLEILLMLLLPFALTCCLMFFGGMMSAEKNTSAGLSTLFFHPKFLSERGRKNHICFLISLLPILLFITFLAVRFMDLPVDVRPVIRFESPDGTKLLVIDEWTRFPPTEWLDPEMSVRFSLIDKNSNALLTKKIVHVREISDVGNPLVSWERDVAKIRAFDSGNENWVVAIPLNE